MGFSAEAPTPNKFNLGLIIEKGFWTFVIRCLITLLLFSYFLFIFLFMILKNKNRFCKQQKISSLIIFVRSLQGNQPNLKNRMMKFGIRCLFTRNVFQSQRSSLFLGRYSFRYKMDCFPELFPNSSKIRFTTGQMDFLTT